MPEALIETRDLDFSFAAREKILHHLNMVVPRGSIYGFLGPNGAGKTTTLRLLLGLLQSKNNGIRIFGLDFRSNRMSILKRIGSLIEQPSLYSHLTGRENLEVFRLSYGCGRKRIREALEIAGLIAAADKKANAYSLGMKQRLAIALALLHDPELLILDEPTNGLDPNGIVETRDLIIKLNREFNKTILVSSHLLSEVEKSATHVGIIHHGELLFQGTMQELRQLKSRHVQSGQSTFEVEVSDPGKARLLLEHLCTVKQVGGLTLHLDVAGKEKMAELNNVLVQNHVNVYKIEPLRNNLEDLFMQIISQ